MTLVIEKVDYSHLIGNPELRNGAGEFRMNVSYPGDKRPATRFKRSEFIHDRRMLTRLPEGALSFVVGKFTAFFDPEIGHLPDDYIDLIKTVSDGLRNAGVSAYSCFEREEFGLKSIRSGYATQLDGLALRRSRFLTKLPGAYGSAGFDKELDEATKLGIDMLALFKEEDPELEHQQQIMEKAAVHGGESNLVFMTYGSREELATGLRIAVSTIAQ